MKVVLICPGKRPAVARLADYAPLVNLPILGKSLVEYWVEEAAAKGAKEVLVLAADRPDEVRSLVGDGARWGLRLEVQPELREPNYEEACARYCAEKTGQAGNCVVRVMDAFPGFPNLRLFTSYASWFQAQQELLRRRAVPSCIGMRELQPGVWVGRGTHIGHEVQFQAPCWIGEKVWLGAKTVLGPGAIVGHRAFVADGAEVTQSIISPDTYAGQRTFVNQSLVCGNQLLNWRTSACLMVSDRFLLCSLREQTGLFKELTVPEPVVYWLSWWLLWPVNVWGYAKDKLEELPAFRRLLLREEA